jgi:ribonuclease BN (tRNA processing enzyme)
VRVTVVGSGTAAPDPDRVGSSFLVEAAGTTVLLDCGPGAVHHLARFSSPWAGLEHLVISHFHNDHTGDLPMLLFAMKWGVAERRTRPLRIWGPAGLKDRMTHMAAAFGDHVTDPGFPVLVTELGPESRVDLAPGLSLACTPTPHADPSLAFRLDADHDAAVGYTGDTGASEEVARFLAGVSLMIAECSVPDDDAMDNHLTPSRLAAMARTARPQRLLVSHVYPALDRLDVLALLRDAGWDGPATRAADGMRFDLG